MYNQQSLQFNQTFNIPLTNVSKCLANKKSETNILNSQPTYINF